MTMHTAPRRPSRSLIVGLGLLSAGVLAFSMALPMAAVGAPLTPPRRAPGPPSLGYHTGLVITIDPENSWPNWHVFVVAPGTSKANSVPLDGAVLRIPNLQPGEYQVRAVYKTRVYTKTVKVTANSDGVVGFSYLP
jgi:hypothetical protein